MRGRGGGTTARAVRTLLAAAALLLGACLGTGPAAAAGGPVGTDPADFTPQLTAPEGRNGNVGVVRQLTPCGGTMYAVGRFAAFSSPAQGGKVYRRSNALAFGGSTGRITAFDPHTDGQVNTIAFDPRDCSTAYLGGEFTHVGGRPAAYLAAVDTRTGALRTGFRHQASKQVDSLAWTHGHLLVGGFFKTVNGADRSRLASLDPKTGAADGYLTLPLAGEYPGTDPTRAYNITVNHHGTQALVTGVFTTVGGAPRQQVFQLDLGAKKATLDGWTAGRRQTSTSTA